MSLGQQKYPSHLKLQADIAQSSGELPRAMHHIRQLLLGQQPGVCCGCIVGLGLLGLDRLRLADSVISVVGVIVLALSLRL